MHVGADSDVSVPVFPFVCVGVYLTFVLVVLFWYFGVCGALHFIIAPPSLIT